MYAWEAHSFQHRLDRHYELDPFACMYYLVAVQDARHPPCLPHPVAVGGLQIIAPELSAVASASAPARQASYLMAQRHQHLAQMDHLLPRVEAVLVRALLT
jgi:hypothetical protein